MKSTWVTYERAYLVTLGLLSLGVCALVGIKQGDEFLEWPIWSYVLSSFLVVFAFTVISIGLLASRERIEQWAEGATTHDASLILMLLAFPVYIAMKFLEKR